MLIFWTVLVFVKAEDHVNFLTVFKWFSVFNTTCKCKVPLSLTQMALYIKYVIITSFWEKLIKLVSYATAPCHTMLLPREEHCMMTLGIAA